METGLRRVVKDALIGKILIQSHPKTGEPSVNIIHMSTFNIVIIFELMVFYYIYSYILLTFLIMFMNVMYCSW